jgi:hypothetical protein
MFLLVSACAFAQIEHPQIGVVLDANGDARVALGVAESATLSEPLWSGVLSLACSAQVCFAKTETALLSSLGEAIDAPAGPAIFAADGASAYVYFPDTQQLARWHDGQLDQIDFTPDGKVLALRVTPAGLDSAVRRGNQVWVGEQNLGDATAVQLLDDGRALLAAGDQVRLFRPDGTELDFAVAGVRSFIRISDVSVQLVTPNGMWALETKPDKEQLYLLPGASRTQDADK